MAAYISFQPTDFYTNTLYSGNATTDTAINLGLEPALTWVKATNDTDGWWQGDVISGPTKDLRSSNTSQQYTSNYGTAYTSTGFTLSDGTQNQASTDYITYSWKGGTTTGLSGGDITPSAYSFNTTSGFGLYQYSGNNTSTQTIPHGLGVAPEFMIFKRTDSTGSWVVYHKSVGDEKCMFLESNAVPDDSSTYFQDTTPTSTYITIGNGGDLNSSGSTNVCYAFAPKKGFSAFGSYTGTGDASISPFIYTGFRPAYTMIKQSSGSGTYGWYILDSKRAGYNPDNEDLLANTTGVEDTTNNFWDLCSNGFKIKTAGGNVNTSGSVYTYVAFAEFPIVSSNDVPVVAR